MNKERRSFFERLMGGGDTAEYEGAPEKRESGAPGKSATLAENNPEEGELPVDVYQSSDAIILKTLVAGVRPEDLDISITRDMVTVRGSREETRDVNGDDYFHHELYWGSFSRTIMLPQEVDVDAAEASERHGLLVIKLPKLDKSRQTKLKVRSN
ncbi:MAG: HSP20 family protein [Parcubacteria group bacterium Gr01-1014_72]|nr:MAG: HSP20 family protein [Parcubacteria group bacterium Gr01-1014_72]